MNLIFSLLGLFGIFVFLILLHEFGHYIAARSCGIGVRRLVLGLGKPVWLWRGRGTCEYGFAWLPLGGYIVFEEEGKTAFKRQAIWRRACVLIAGPAINIIAAWLLFCCVFSLGIQQARPIIVDVTTGSPAALAHISVPSVITAIDGETVSSWRRVTQQLVERIGDQETLQLSVRDLKSNKIRTYPMSLKHWQLDPYQPQLITSLGLQPQQPLEIVTEVYPVTTASVRAGVEVWRWLRLQTFVIGKVLIGDIPLSMLAGPFTLAELAITVPQAGWVSLWHLLAVVSLLLGFINLLPLPGLDGGHCLYLLIEKVRGRPLSSALQLLLWRLMIIIFLVLLIQVTVNDLLRFFAFSFPV